MKTVALIEDDTDLFALLKYNFENEGFRTVGSQTGKDAIELCRRERPDVVILDIMLPDSDGIDICRQLRANPELARTPVIFLTARASESDRILGLELGANDYVVKPFSVRELVARVRNQMRAPAPSARVLRCDGLELERDSCRVRLHGKQLTLTATEFRLIEFDKSAAADFGYFIDPQTLSVDKDGVVRYVLVARSMSGAQNVTYEGLRCASAEHRFYAFGRADGTWSRSRSGWRSLVQGQPLQRILYADYFCPQKVAILNAAEGVRALRDGGHPFAKGFGGEYGKGR